MAKRIVIMAGGTGGHVFPALAVAKYLQSQAWQVSWLGTQQGMESRVVPEHGIMIDWLPVSGVRGKGLFSKLKAPIMLLKACAHAYKILRLRQPDVVLGMGGFVAGPGGLMARLQGIPLVIHEQNRIPGTTNRWLAKFASVVLQAFHASFSENSKAITTGNPLRMELLNLGAKVLWDGRREFRVLVLGGSQGAQVLNELLPPILAKIPGIRVKHQCGKVMAKQVAEVYDSLNAAGEAMPFIDDMRAAYEWADMLICRAGAMTVSEIAAAGLPAIFIPFPFAIDDHQTANARFMVDAGAALMTRQADLNEQDLLAQIEWIQKNIQSMSLKAKAMARLDATECVANVCVEQAA